MEGTVIRQRRTLFVALGLTLLLVLISRSGVENFDRQDPIASDSKDAGGEDAAHEDAVQEVADDDT